ncbi:MAG TPA: acetate kinase [Candidatus Binatia bacterium]|nr:acetate kinase [Candidatus Binatia bacterium]
MKILVINSGSSSIKFQLISMEKQLVLAKGLLERIGIKGSILSYYRGEQKTVVEHDIANHEEGIHFIVNYLTDAETGVIKDKKEIYAVGHRVVHAGEKFNGTVPITDAVLAALKECIPLAPLHNPPNIVGIEACQKILPGIPMAGTFDTAFHQTMPEKAYIYPIPYDYYRKHKIRRYGFHGTSHFFVAKQGAKAMGKKLQDLKIITCHLGNGSSMAAIRNGVSIDTTMGFTPLEGLVMGTRCGDIDPAIPMYLQRSQGMTFEQVDALLNRKSGMLGISEVSSDMRDINQKAAEGHHQARLALEIFAYRIKKYIGAYIAAMNGVDLIIFTAGIGERGCLERQMVLEDMEYLGIRFDSQANEKAFGKFGIISAPASKVCVMVVPTNEELEIAEQTLKVISENPR